MVSTTSGLYLAPDTNGYHMHLRKSSNNECIGHVEVGTFELMKQIILEEALTNARKAVPNRQGEGSQDSDLPEAQPAE